MKLRTLTVGGTLAALIVLPLLLAQDHAGNYGQLLRQPAPRSLEEILEVALVSNPDVLLAEAKVREAQASLNQTRLKVMQSVAKLFYERRKLDRIQSDLARQLEVIRKRIQAGTLATGSATEPTLAVAENEARKDQVQAELRYAMGLGGRVTPSAKPKAAQAPTPAPSRSPIPEKYRQLLETPLRVEWQQAPVNIVLETLQKATGGKLAFVLGPEIDTEEVVVTLALPADVPLKSALLAMADQWGQELCFVFRDYGVILTDRDSAQQLRGATIPQGVPLEHE